MKEIAKAILIKDIQQLEQMLQLGPPGVAALLPMVKTQLAEKKAALAQLED